MPSACHARTKRVALTLELGIGDGAALVDDRHRVVAVLGVCMDRPRQRVRTCPPAAMDLKSAIEARGTGRVRLGT